MVFFRQFVILLLIHIYTWVQFNLQEKLFLQKSTLNSSNFKKPYEMSYWKVFPTIDFYKHRHLVKWYKNIKAIYQYSHMQGLTIKTKQRLMNNRNRDSPPEVSLQKGFLKICCTFTGEHPCQRVISIKLQIALRHGCFLVNLLRIFRTTCPKKSFRGLLL